jgi:Mrp family chromosome partitioning ATPase
MKTLPALFSKKIRSAKAKTAYQQQDESGLVEDAFHLLRTNISMQTLGQRMHSFMITSTLPNEGKSTLAIKLASQFASGNQRVLIINADTRRPTVEKYLKLAQTEGLTDLFFKLYADPVTSGKISDFGLTDLFYLVHLQAQTGRLYLKTSRDEVYTAVFDQGILCAIESPENNLNHRLLQTLISLKKIAPEEGTMLATRAEQMNIPLAKLLLDFNLCQPSDLKNIYEFELASLFKELFQFPLVTFEFKPGSADHYKSVTALLQNSQELLLDQLQNHQYISRQINRCVASVSNNFYCMPSGALKMKISEIFTEQRLSRVIRILRHQFDYIFFDTPPMTIGAEGTVVGSVTDGTILVIKSDYASRQKIQKTVQQLKQAKVNLIGTILNEAPMRNEKYAYYNYHT